MIDMGDNPIITLASQRERSLFGDKRLEHRGARLFERIDQQGSIVMRRLGKDEAEQKSFRRF